MKVTLDDGRQLDLPTEPGEHVAEVIVIARVTDSHGRDKAQLASTNEFGDEVGVITTGLLEQALSYQYE